MSSQWLAEDTWTPWLRGVGALGVVVVLGVLGLVVVERIRHRRRE